MFQRYAEMERSGYSKNTSNFSPDDMTSHPRREQYSVLIVTAIRISDLVYWPVCRSRHIFRQKLCSKKYDLHVHSNLSQSSPSSWYGLKAPPWNRRGWHSDTTNPYRFSGRYHLFLLLLVLPFWWQQCCCSIQSCLLTNPTDGLLNNRIQA
jgi:hypothetical protein